MLAGAATKATGVTQDRLAEALRAAAPDAANALTKFIEVAAADGIFLEPATKSLMLKWRGPDEKDYTLGGVVINGKFDTQSVGWVPSAIGRIDLAHEYLGSLAKLVQGVVRKTRKPVQWYVVQSEVTLPDAAVVLGHSAELLSAMRSYVDKLRSAIEARE
jgi:hypothetical protein